MITTIKLITVAMLIVLIAKIACNVYEKAGYPKYFGLLIFLPVINLVILYNLAFSEWPIHKNINDS